MMGQIKTVLSCTLTILWSTSALAAQAELRSEDGFVSIDGEILEFDGTMLTVNTGSGVVKIPGNSVTCFGEGCPDGVRKGTKSIAVAFAHPQERALLTEILNADRAGGAFNVSFDGSDTVSVSNPSGEVSLALLRTGAEGDVRILSEVAAVADPDSLIERSEWTSRDQSTVQLLESQALAVLVSAPAGIDVLTLEDLARVFAGEVKNWSELGGNDVAIQPMQTGEGHATHDALRLAVTEPFGKQVSNRVLNAKDDALVLNTLAIAPGGVAVLPVDQLDGRQPIALVGECQHPSRPDDFSIANGSYPLTVSTFAEISPTVASASLSATFDQLSLGWTGSDMFESDLARLARLESILEEDLPPDLNQSAKDFAASVFSANRLAVTFRDGPVSKADAARERLGFVRLAAAVANGDFDGREIMFVGFTGGRSDPTAAVSRSTEAAESLLTAFREFAPEAASRPGVSFVAQGHGFVGHSNCDAADATKPFIEIWIRSAG